MVDTNIIGTIRSTENKDGTAHPLCTTPDEVHIQNVALIHATECKCSVAI